MMLMAYLPAILNSHGEAVYEDDSVAAYAVQPMSLTLLVQPRSLTILSFHYLPRVPFGHAVNVLLHAVNGILLWAILRKLSSASAWFWTGLFWLHPVQVEAVAYFVARGELLAGFGVLAMVWAVMAIRQDWLSILVVTLAGLGAMMAKEATGLSVLLWLPLIGLWLGAQRSRWVIPCLIWAVMLGWYVSHVIWIGVAPIAWMARQASAVWHLVRLLVWPFGFSIETPAPWHPWMALLALACVLVISLFKRHAALTFAGLWLVIWSLPRLLLAQPLPSQPGPFHEHHAYSLLIGLCLSGGLAWRA